MSDRFIKVTTFGGILGAGACLMAIDDRTDTLLALLALLLWQLSIMGFIALHEREQDKETP